MWGKGAQGTFTQSGGTNAINNSLSSGLFMAAAAPITSEGGSLSASNQVIVGDTGTGNLYPERRHQCH